MEMGDARLVRPWLLKVTHRLVDPWWMMQRGHTTFLRHRRLWRLLTVTTVAVTACTGPQVPRQAGPGSATVSSTPRFVVVCRFDHRRSDDPIVFPGVPGASHSHDFFGNTSTGAFSNSAGLLSNTLPAAYGEVFPGTTCGRSGDKSAYWTPTLTKGDLAYPSNLVRAYYRSATSDRTAVQPIPAGLRMIAGNARATAPQPISVTSWACGSGGDQTEVSSAPTCPTGVSLHLKVAFPNCWNGRDLDSPDHKSHLSYSSGGHCPQGFPVALPKISLIFRYTGVSGSGVHLACGNDLCAHADFMDGWAASAQSALVVDCIRRGLDCGEVGGPGGGVVPTGAGIPGSAPAPAMTM